MNGNFNDAALTIGFKYIDRYGSKFEAESTVPIFEGLGDNERGVILEQFVNFLNQAGFAIGDRHILNDPLTDEEQDAVTDYLIAFRNGEVN